MVSNSSCLYYRIASAGLEHLFRGNRDAPTASRTQAPPAVATRSARAMATPTARNQQPVRVIPSARWTPAVRTPGPGTAVRLPADTGSPPTGLWRSQDLRHRQAPPTCRVGGPSACGGPRQGAKPPLRRPYGLSLGCRRRGYGWVSIQPRAGEGAPASPPRWRCSPALVPRWLGLRLSGTRVPGAAPARTPQPGAAVDFPRQRAYFCSPLP